ncbi:hypothetical protein Efla_003203 [Eimeria flavescens]
MTLISQLVSSQLLEQAVTRCLQWMTSGQCTDRLRPGPAQAAAFPSRQLNYLFMSKTQCKMVRSAALVALVAVASASGSLSMEDPSFMETVFFRKRQLDDGSDDSAVQLPVSSPSASPTEQQELPEGQAAGELGESPTFPGISQGLLMEREPSLDPDATARVERESPASRFFRIVRQIFAAMRPRLD